MKGNTGVTENVFFTPKVNLNGENYDRPMDFGAAQFSDKAIDFTTSIVGIELQ